MEQGGVHTGLLPNGRWGNQVNGKVISSHREKESAEEAGREIARKLRVAHIVDSGAVKG